MTDPMRKEYLAVEFEAPLAGIWSPPKKQAPFVCIEPWYGHADFEDFTGELKDKEGIEKLKVGQVFNSAYTVTIK